MPGDLPPISAPEIIPQADVVAITGMTSLINGTFEALAALPGPKCVRGGPRPFHAAVAAPVRPRALTPSSGAVITDISAALAAVSQGANFRQISGKRLLTMAA